MGDDLNILFFSKHPLGSGVSPPHKFTPSFSAGGERNIGCNLVSCWFGLWEAGFFAWKGEMLFSDCHMADEMNIKTSSCSAVKKPNIQADFPFGYQSLSSLTFRKLLCDKGSLLILASWSFFFKLDGHVHLTTNWRLLFCLAILPWKSITIIFPYWSFFGGVYFPLVLLVMRWHSF